MSNDFNFYERWGWGGGGRGGAKIRIPMLIFGNGNPYIY